jgi:hypothetical protein
MKVYDTKFISVLWVQNNWVGFNLERSDACEQFKSIGLNYNDVKWFGHLNYRTDLPTTWEDIDTAILTTNILFRNFKTFKHRKT